LYFNDGFSTALKFEETWDELNQEDILECVKRTYQPNWKKRKAKHGFLARNATVAGRRLNKRRALAGRRISI
jgi:ribosomal protein L34